MINFIEDSLLGDFSPQSRFNIYKDKKKRKRTGNIHRLKPLNKLLNSTKDSLQSVVGSDTKYHLALVSIHWR